MPKKYPKKKFFREPTETEIISQLDNFVSADSDLIKILEESLDERQGLIIEKGLVPEGFTHRKFRKHGGEILLDYQKYKTPFEARDYELNHLDNSKIYTHLSFTPLKGKDRRKRIITPIAGLEAARIIYHSYHTYRKQAEDLSFIEIKPYDETRRAGIDGITATAKVPSRTICRILYKFNLTSIPVIDNKNKLVIASSIGSTHECEEKQFLFGYAKEEDEEEFNVLYLDEHDQAAFWKLAKYYWEEEKNIVPLEMSPFLFPTQFAINIYLDTLNKVLIRDEREQNKDKLRKPDKLEKNILLFEAIKEYGHRKIFYGKEKLNLVDWGIAA